MLRYKNSLLERILLEKGAESSFSFWEPRTNMIQASMYKLNSK
jgi:hypothetical protein